MADYNRTYIEGGNDEKLQQISSKIYTHVGGDKKYESILVQMRNDVDLLKFTKNATKAKLEEQIKELKLNKVEPRTEFGENLVNTYLLSKCK